MIKTIDGIIIMGNHTSFRLNNTKNSSHFSFNAENGNVSFRDSMGNMVQNYSSTISINFEVFKLTQMGQTINMNDGSMIAYLSSEDIYELAERTFYEEEQTQVYDFLNGTFTIELE